MVNHYAFAQPWLARQDLRKFAWLLADEHDRNFHTSYAIAWLQMLMDYYDYTGDPTDWLWSHPACVDRDGEAHRPPGA